MVDIYQLLGVFSCDCPLRFDGPRCQQLRHSFNGDSWAQYKTLPQCGNGTTSIEVITVQSDGIILYNGPDRDPGMYQNLHSMTILFLITDGIVILTNFVCIGLDSSLTLCLINYTGNDADAVTDYIAIGVSNGKPIVYVNYGTGAVKLEVNTIINDGMWHKLEISKIDRV